MGKKLYEINDAPYANKQRKGTDGDSSNNHGSGSFGRRSVRSDLQQRYELVAYGHADVRHEQPFGHQLVGDDKCDEFEK